jgi:alpha-glucosidase
MTLDRQLDSALNQFNKWGIDFIMTDFIDRDDQKAINFSTGSQKHALIIR